MERLPRYEKFPDSLPESPARRERRLRFEHSAYLSEVASRRAMVNNTSAYEELEFLKACERFHTMDGKLTVSVSHLRGKE
jgi:hypothetical protein